MAARKNPTNPARTTGIDLTAYGQQFGHGIALGLQKGMGNQWPLGTQAAGGTGTNTGQKKGRGGRGNKTTQT